MSQGTSILRSPDVVLTRQGVKGVSGERVFVNLDLDRDRKSIGCVLRVEVGRRRNQGRSEEVGGSRKRETSRRV